MNRDSAPFAESLVAPRPAPDQRILILAPLGNDARLTAGFLEGAGLKAHPCHDAHAFAEEARAGCDAWLVAEEALNPESAAVLGSVLAAQPSWSDVPIIIVASGGSEASAKRRARLSSFGPGGNVSILERPFRPATLVSALQTALRARRRQYEVRDLLEKRRAGHEHLEFVLEAGDLGIWMLDLRSGVLTCSANFKANFGVPPDESFSYEQHAALIHPDDREMWHRRVDEAIASGRDLHLEYRVVAPEGESRWVQVKGRIARDSDGAPLHLSGISQNITARKDAEESLRESKARLKFALDAAQIGDWDLDLTTDRAQRSLRHDQAFGHFEPVAEWGFAEFIQHVHPDDREQIEAQFRESVAGGGDWNIECRVIWPDGSPHWIAAHGSIYRTAEGRPARMLGIVNDITTRKNAETALREGDRRKDEFLAMLAHELRNPLASVSNAATLLREGVDDRDREWAAEVIARQSSQLARLVDDLLDVSRITRGKIELRKERLDAARCLESACEAVAPEIAGRNHTLLADFPRGELWVEADPTRLEQIVVNLLANAAKYSKDHGNIRLTAQQSDGEIIIRVSDNGIGIPRERIPEMFELFAQGERSAARSEGGLGIGLTVVRGLCELHGGSVDAESDGPGKGSTFTVRLPAAAIALAAHRDLHSRTATPPPRTGTRVLVVDDNVDTAAGLSRLLIRRGYVVELAHDGPTALEKARTFAPAAVLLDIGLPGMDGYDVARRLRAEPAAARAVILALSGYGQEEDRTRSRAAGFDHHLVKPIDFGVLHTLLGEFLRNRPTIAPTKFSGTKGRNFAR